MNISMKEREKLTQLFLAYRTQIIKKEVTHLADYIVKTVDITHRETLKMVGEWLDKWWETGKMGKQDWYEFEAFIQNTKKGELPLSQSGEE